MSGSIIIDYSFFYFKEIAKTDIPYKHAGKFVQIKNGNTEYLVFSPKELCAYHANIVERFCLDKGIKGSYNKKQDIFTIYEQGWSILGGGKYEADTVERQLLIFGDSMAYGRFIQEGLREKIEGIEPYKGYIVSIDNFA